MAPYRASRSTRSGRPGAQNDVDIIDGLPVRQWRMQEFFVGPSTSELPPDSNANEQAEKAQLTNGHSEIKHPQGSHYYKPWCQQLLRAAREGTLGKRKERDEDHDEEKENGEGQEDGAEPPSKTGFLARKWGLLPRNAEESEHDYLAPRRPGLPKLDATGNQILGPNGETVMNGATTEEPVRRRMPPPRRKPKKGPGRRKKMTEGDGTGVSASAEALEAQADGGGTPAGGDARHSAEGGGDDNDNDEGEDEDVEEGSEDGEVVETETKDTSTEVKSGHEQKVLEAPTTNGASDISGQDTETKRATRTSSNEPAGPTENPDKEEGELDGDGDEEEYEPPPAKEEDDDEIYEPPPPRALAAPHPSLPAKPPPPK